MIGIEERDTQSGIHVFRIHYTADPLKRSVEWQDEAARGMVGGRTGKAWRREMEIDWTVASGLPVYAEEYVRDIHVAKQPIEYDPSLVVYRGWDFGNTPACVWAQMDSLSRLLFIRELVTWDGRGPQRSSNIEAMMPLVTAISSAEFPGAHFIDYADPAGWSRSQTDGKSCVDIMTAYLSATQGYADIRPGPMSWSARNNAMTRALTRMVSGAAALQISPTCSMLVEGFEGAYKFKEKGQSGLYTGDPEKNAWSHPMDGAHYVVGALFTPHSDDPVDDAPHYEHYERSPNRSGAYY